jgi:hypothetical protein
MKMGTLVLLLYVHVFSKIAVNKKVLLTKAGFLRKEICLTKKIVFAEKASIVSKAYVLIMHGRTTDKTKALEQKIINLLIKLT